MCVVLDVRKDRFAASIRALEYGFAAYDRTDLVVEGRRYAGVDVPYRRGETIDLVAERGVESLVDASPRVELETELREELPDSANAGVALGEVVVRVDGEKIGGARWWPGPATEGPRWETGCGIPLRGFSQRRDRT